MGYSRSCFPVCPAEVPVGQQPRRLPYANGARSTGSGISVPKSQPTTYKEASMNDGRRGGTEVPKPDLWHKDITGYVVIGLFLLAIVWMAVRWNETPPTKGQQASEPTLSTTVRFTGTQIVVINRDNFDWRDCKIAINSGIFGGGWTTNVARIAAGDTVRGGILTFTRRGGERFNPATHAVETITVICQTPLGLALWEGEWR